MGKIMEGRYTCKHCDIDKSWTLVVEGDPSESDLIEVAKRQRREVSNVSYPEPPHELVYKIRYPDPNKEGPMIQRTLK